MEKYKSLDPHDMTNLQIIARMLFGKRDHDVSNFARRIAHDFDDPLAVELAKMLFFVANKKWEDN